MMLDHSAKALAVPMVRQWLIKRLLTDWLNVIRFELTETEVVFDLTGLSTSEYRRFIQMLRGFYLLHPVGYDDDYSWLDWQDAQSFLPIKLNHFRVI